MGRIDARLKELNIDLPSPPDPVASYAPFIVAQNLVFVSGQISVEPSGVIKGRLGAEMDLASGQAAARQCGFNLLAQLRKACGDDLDRVVRVVRLGVFVQCEQDFIEQPVVADGASLLMTEVFGEIGRHARAAVGVSALPLGAAVEIDGVFEINA